jgi:hypothetical protein
MSASGTSDSPAKAGAQRHGWEDWVPAFAGTQEGGTGR